MKLFLHESKVEWDSVSNQITYRCMLTANSKSPGAPSTAAGLAVASDKPVPVIRGEIRFPKISGYLDRYFYSAEKVRVVIEVEPKTPPVKAPERKFKAAQQYNLPNAQQYNPPAASAHDSTVNTTGTWVLIGTGVTILTITILADFLTGVSIADDVVTIPAALRMIGTGAARFIFPAIVRRVALPKAYVGAGMALKAAH